MFRLDQVEFIKTCKVEEENEVVHCNPECPRVSVAFSFFLLKKSDKKVTSLGSASSNLNCCSGWTVDSTCKEVHGHIL